MSEYQYYEFQAIDRPLTPKERNELREYSTRARITPTSFINDYSWGHFKGNPNVWIEKYFDAFLYLANWGTRELKLRLPSSLLTLEIARSYCSSDVASSWEKNGKIILSFISEEEPGGEWEEGEGWLSSIIPVRAELARGDHRCLYLAWLLSVQHGEMDEDDEEPDMPEGLAELSASLVSFSDFLRIDRDLLHAAAQTSPPIHMTRPNQEEVLAWLRTLPAGEKDSLLLRFILNEEAHLGAGTLTRFFKEKQSDSSSALKSQKRTIKDLISASDKCREARRRAEAEKAAEEKVRRDADVAALRERRLQALAGREAETWKQVDQLIAARQPDRYDEAVSLLIDLRDIATHKGKAGEFLMQIGRLREHHGKKPSFLAKLKKAGL